MTDNEKLLMDALTLAIIRLESIEPVLFSRRQMIAKDKRLIEDVAGKSWNDWCDERMFEV